jgi:protein SCO1
MPGKHRQRLPRRTVLIVIAMSLMSVGCGSPSISSSVNSSWSGVALVNPLHKPEFVLTDQFGHPFDFQGMTRDKITLLYFGYTHCPDVCPLNMATAAGALRRVPAWVREKVAVVFVTVDPTRDTPQVLREWLARFDPSFVGLTGTLAQIEVAEVAAGTPAPTQEPDGKGGYGVDHGGSVIAYTADDLAHLEYPGGVSAAAEARDLVRLATHGWSTT